MAMHPSWSLPREHQHGAHGGVAGLPLPSSRARALMPSAAAD